MQQCSMHHRSIAVIVLWIQCLRDIFFHVSNKPCMHVGFMCNMHVLASSRLGATILTPRGGAIKKGTSSDALMGGNFDEQFV